MTAEHPKATVLISTYNRPEFLKEAIQSVVDQTMTDWELLVMNDGGTDVAHVVAGFNDTRIRYFPDSVNKGAAHRFNFGLAHARGDYIAYLGDDDLFYPNHLAVLSEALDNNPEIAVAYSDLYAVSCVVDKARGKRYVLDKRIQVSRDFNRDFMLHFNHVLHVSLLHRKEAAFRVGCFDESVKVLIEWSLNRKMSLIYDFLHVNVPTGEYYMPVFKSDRISVVQRKDKDSYKHNLRKIKANLPDRPWTYYARLNIIYPVSVWNEPVREMLCDLYDNITHPFRLVLVNNGTGLSREQCAAALGNVAELKNLSIVNSTKKLDELDAYRFGAKKYPADYLLLISDRFQPKAITHRVLGGMNVLKNSLAEGIKWHVDAEKESQFELLIGKDVFLKKSNLKKGRPREVNIKTIGLILPQGYQFDTNLAQYKRHFSRGDYQQALESLNAARAVTRGAPGMQYMISSFFMTLINLKRYDEAEQELRALIARGYRYDNYIRLGRVLQLKGQYREAVDCYQASLNQFGLKDEDLASPIFPFNFPKELSAFTALIGLGECFFALGNVEESARMYHRAAKLRANSHRPFLGFAKQLFKDNQLDRVEMVLANLAGRDAEKDPETHRLLGRLANRRGQPELAFSCFLRAYERGKQDEQNIDPLFSTGKKLGRWAEMKPVFEEFHALRPDALQGMIRLAETYHQLGMHKQALALAEQGLALAPSHMILKRIARKAEEADRTAMPESFEDKAWFDVRAPSLFG